MIAHMLSHLRLPDAPSDDPAQQVYDRLWAAAEGAFLHGELQLDPYLRPGGPVDTRRGLCLVAWPAADAVTGFTRLAAELQALEPDQYYYAASEYHVTVLTLINAHAQFDLAAAPVARYRQALAEVFRCRPPLAIHFRGVTASPAAAIIQGYAAGDALNGLRDALREALAAAGLAATLDTRYRIITAHVTCLRLRAPLRDPLALRAFLAAARERDFGMTVVDRVDLVNHDWYMSQGRTHTLATYPLASA